MPPFALDCQVCALAQASGLEVRRIEKIEVTDEAALRAAGLMRECPDYRRIAALLAAGRPIRGGARGRHRIPAESA